MPTAQELVLRSLALHREVARKVRMNTELLEIARAILKRWHATVSPRTFTYLDEWQRLLDLGVEACLTVATEDSERAAALRQASPLACLLSPSERFAFFRQWKVQNAPPGA